MPFFSNADDSKVVKQDGKCLKRTKWRHCPQFTKRTSRTTKKVFTFRCRVFNKNKPDANSLPECNERYGLSYEGEK